MTRARSHNMVHLQMERGNLPDFSPRPKCPPSANPPHEEGRLAGLTDRVTLHEKIKKAFQIVSRRSRTPVSCFKIPEKRLKCPSPPSSATLSVSLFLRLPASSLSSNVQRTFSFFASQTLHNIIFLKKKIRRSKRQRNFSLFYFASQES